jgi:AraC-like DNA-binding protein
MNNKLFTPQLLRFDEFKDLEIINAVSQGWEIRWKYLKKGGAEAKFWVFTTPRMQFSWVGYDNGIMIESSPPLGSVQVSFVRTQGVCNSHYKRVEKYELIIVKGGEEANYLASDMNEIFSLVLEQRFFEETFYQYFEKHLEEMRTDYRLAMSDDGIDGFILQMENWLCYFQDEGKPQLTMEMFFAIEEGIVADLFAMIHVKGEKKVKQQCDTVRARKILESNLENIYTINDLVKELDVSARTLQHSFKTTLGVSAKHYLQSLRLNAIRHELLYTTSRHTVISDIASQYGYFYHSHLTQEYKQLFGETPSATLSRRMNALL